MISVKILYLFLFVLFIASCADNQVPIASSDGKGSVESQKHACKRDFTGAMLTLSQPSMHVTETERKNSAVVFILIYSSCMRRASESNA